MVDVVLIELSECENCGLKMTENLEDIRLTNFVGILCDERLKHDFCATAELLVSL